MWGLLRCLSGDVSLWEGVPGPMRGRVCVCMCACAPAGLGFVCFPPNWLVFPCPAHQTACFSSHLASPPGLEPPACTRPTRRSREEGRAAHTPGQARSGWAGQGDPAPALSRPHPHSSSCLAFKAHGLSQSYLVASLNAPQFLDSQMPSFCLPQAALSFPASQG